MGKSFNFTKAFEDAKKDLENSKLFLILLGASGNGKSYAQGTFGCKTLYLYTQGESHGPKSASTLGGNNIFPVCIDREGGKALSADASLERLNTILDDVASIKEAGFEAISIDGATEIESLIRNSTKFSTLCKSPYDEGPITLNVFRGILNKLKNLQRELGVHVCMTCILNVKEYGDNGIIVDSEPRLHGFQVATGLVQQFDDVMVIGRVQGTDKKGEDRVAYVLQLLAGVNKTTKDFTTKEVRKTYNFSPRLTGVDILSLKSTIKAELSQLIELKRVSK